MTTLQSAPSGICAYCWSMWQSNPTPLLYCQHMRTVARRTACGAWKTLKAVTDDELRDISSLLGVHPQIVLRLTEGATNA